MLTLRLDYINGGLAILDILESKKIEKFIACYKWRIIFQYGNTSDINFILNELRSSDQCFFRKESDLYQSLNDLLPALLLEIDNFVVQARKHKEDEKELTKVIEEWYLKDLEENKANLKRLDKQIRDFSNLDIARELEKRGLIV